MYYRYIFFLPVNIVANEGEEMISMSCCVRELGDFRGIFLYSGQTWKDSRQNVCEKKIGSVLPTVFMPSHHNLAP